MLELAPNLEREFVERAAATGMTPDQYLSKLLAVDPIRPTPSQPKPQVVPDDDPVLMFFRSQLAEAANATPEEIAADDAEYRKWQQSIDAPRQANSERLLFPDAARR